LSPSAYFLPSGEVKLSVRRTASIRPAWPVTTLSQVGDSESSKSAMKMSAPELSALISILGSTGPVISTWRRCRSAGVAATFQLPRRTDSVSASRPYEAPALISASRLRRASSRLVRTDPNLASRSPTNRSASAVNTRRPSAVIGPVMSIVGIC
jgi:hypothetical protein